MAWIRFASPAFWVVFVCVFLAVAVWETRRPEHPLSWPAERRWRGHAALFALSAIAQTFVFRIGAVVLAASVAQSRWGVLNKPWPPLVVRCIAAFVLLDLVRYATHRTFHSVHVLWRVHEVHHSDPDYDVSTAGRFHPIEIVLTQGVYLAAIAALAPPPVAVFAAEIVAAVMNLFVHANASLPRWAGQALLCAVVTPDMHRIHHSEDCGDQSRNFGQTLCWWDRLFGTYVAAPAGGEDGMVTGIADLRGEASLGLRFMLSEPFRRRGQAKANPAS